MDRRCHHGCLGFSWPGTPFLYRALNLVKLISRSSSSHLAIAVAAELILVGFVYANFYFAGLRSNNSDNFFEMELGFLQLMYSCVVERSDLSIVCLLTLIT